MSTIQTVDELDFRTLLKPNDVVTWLGGTAEPMQLVSHLSAQAGECPHFSVLLGIGLAETMSENCSNVTVRAFGGAGTNKRFFSKSAGGVLPLNVSNLCQMVAAREIKIDVVLLQVTGPDDRNRYSAGTCIQYLHEAIDCARLVVAQINRNVPWTDGDTLIDGKLFDITVEADSPLLQVPPFQPGPIQMDIGNHIGRLVGDRSVIELGLGAIPDAATLAFASRRGLGLHSGVIGDGVLALIEAGVIDNRHKDIDEGVSVTMALHGTDRLNAYAAHNKSISIRSPRYTHDPAVLARLDRFVAINSAIEVDLTGQVNAETLLGRHVGIVGGQVDFVRAAMRSTGGRSIIALPATAGGGAHSRIVSRLKDAVVTTPRADADVVVTEYGIAELRGRTLEERVKAMVAIAAPEFRKELILAAERIV